MYLNTFNTIKTIVKGMCLGQEHLGTVPPHRLLSVPEASPPSSRAHVYEFLKIPRQGGKLRDQEAMSSGSQGLHRRQ